MLITVFKLKILKSADNTVDIDHNYVQTLLLKVYAYCR